MTKICSKCGVDKPLDQYHKDSKGGKGLKACCKPCNIAVAVAWAKDNPEKAAAKARLSYDKRRKIPRIRPCATCGIEYTSTSNSMYCTPKCRLDAVCAIDGCDDAVLSKSLCRKHYFVKRDLSMKDCSVEGCNNRSFCKGWCKTHYHRWYRSGDPLPTPQKC